MVTLVKETLCLNGPSGECNVWSKEPSGQWDSGQRIHTCKFIYQVLLILLQYITQVLLDKVRGSGGGPKHDFV